MAGDIATSADRLVIAKKERHYCIERMMVLMQKLLSIRFRDLTQMRLFTNCYDL